jgi:hypothetical protein
MRHTLTGLLLAGATCAFAVTAPAVAQTHPKKHVYANAATAEVYPSPERRDGRPRTSERHGRRPERRLVRDRQGLHGQADRPLRAVTQPFSALALALPLIRAAPIFCRFTDVGHKS